MSLGERQANQTDNRPTARHDGQNFAAEGTAMANGRTPNEIKRVRNEVLVAMKLLYPAALQADQIQKTLLGIFPMLEWEAFRRDLAYLCEKGYLERVIASTEPDAPATPWRKRWLRLTSRGMEIAEHVIADPAMDE